MTRPLVVIGAGESWDGTRLADRHVAEHLVDRADVLYVDPPVHFRSARSDPRLAESLAGPALRPAADGVWRLTPRVLPRSWYPGLRELARARVSSALRGALDTLGRRPDAILSVRDDLFGVTDAPEFFWARDNYAASAALTGLPTRRFERSEQFCARHVRGAIAVTEELARKWEALGVPAEVVPNGVDVARFDRDDLPAPPEVHLPPPIVGFAGTMSARMDLSLLHGVVDAGCSLLLVGAPQITMPIDEFEALFRRPGVQHVGGRGYEELPPFLAAMDVGLVPYTDSPFNRASFPLKLLEYLAAGVPVVSTDLPAVRSLGTDLVAIGDGASFIDHVLAQVPQRHDAAQVAARRHVAAQHSWADRAARIADILGI